MIGHCFFLCSLVACLALQSEPSWKLLIVSDTNRDGKISFKDDAEGRKTWTNLQGAVFLFNNDSDQDNGKQDCADQIVNGPADLLDLEPLFIQQVPQIEGDTRLLISVSEPARPFVNLFYKSGNDYVFIENTGGQELPVQLLKEGDVELRLEAKSYAFPGWDGKAEITAVLESRGESQSDSVELRVAPFILLSAVEPALRITIRDLPGQNEQLVRTLRELTSELGVELKIIGTDDYPEWEMWLQDIMEVGYSKMTGHGHHVVLKANRGRPLDEMPEKEMLGPDHGWFRFGDHRPEQSQGRGGDGWLDWYGNLEVTPPLPGQPLGRILYGYNRSTGNSLNPQIVQMLEAQEAQTPLIKIHTGWLLIKHVDEIFNFIPARGGKGFKVLVPDVTVTYRLLDQWNSDGRGRLPIFKDLKKDETIETLVKDGKLREFNGRLQKEEVEFSIDGLRNAIGLNESDLIRIPALFEPFEGSAPALMPNMVNSVYMNGHMLMADPRGPLDDGQDLIQEYVKGLLKKEGVEAHFVDDLAYHNRGGNVHCATNVTYLSKN